MANPAGDPYSLNNSDHPGMALTQVHFNGKNFLAWDRQIRRSLGAKMKLGFVDGTLPLPARNDLNYARWIRCDNMVMSWILASMTPEMSNSFVFTKSARELMLEITERYKQTNGPLIFRLRQEISGILQDELTVIEYYSKLKCCWDELDMLRGLPACSCGRIDQCRCDILGKMTEMMNEDRVIDFLMGLNGEYESVRSQIISMDPVPSLSKAYYIVMQVETQKKGIQKSIDHAGFHVNQSKEGGGSGFMAGTNGFQRKNNQEGQRDYGQKEFKKNRNAEKRFCTYCKGDGHTADYCFEVIGYPDWFKGKRNRKVYRTVAQAGAEKRWR